MTSVGFVLVFLLSTLNKLHSFFYHSVLFVHFEQVNAGCVQNMYVSSWQKNHISATTKTRKGVTLYEVKYQNNVEVVLVLCCLSLNFYLASISFATLRMYFVYWFNLANLKTIVLAFIRNSRECRVFLVSTCLYHDSRLNLCFTLTTTASVRWEIRQNLTIFFVNFPVKGTCEGFFLIKLQAVFYQLQFYQR